MEMYNVSGHGNLIQGTETNPLLTNPLLEQVDTMYNEGAPEFFVDQGLYYPTSTNYGYYCTGFESPGEWEDHQRVFGADGQEFQYAGAQNESLPYVYYAPSYGYTQSPYNPYNPYIPGAMIGVDGSYVGAQQFYAIPPYQDTLSSSGYVPVVVPSDSVPNNLTDLLLDTGGVTFVNRADGRSSKHGLASSSAPFPTNQTKPSLSQTNSVSRMSEGPRTNSGPSKQASTLGSGSSGGFPIPPSSRMLQGRGASGSIQAVDNFSNVRVLPPGQLKVALPVNNGFSDFGSSAPGRAAADKLRSKIHVGRSLDVNGGQDALCEQNRGPRTNKTKNQLAVKAYTTKAGDNNGHGNIIIYTDQYNKEGFPVDYVDAKFFVIKSYSEDDVHKSIKYNVWSSTPHGNKKLQGAYEEAQKIVSGKSITCPIFLFFSVNASGQFCGVAEMIGPVDFHKDMDFWQQDKWNGSFPVKWHIIKDVQNSSFRHIILENNENKPVTNSRDTQEVLYEQGQEMLKIFKNHTSKTSLLDDFMYYENRQRIMQEEKVRAMFKTFEPPFLVPAADAPCKLDHVEQPPNRNDKTIEQNGPSSMNKTDSFFTERASSNSGVTVTSVDNEISEQTIVKSGDEITSVLKIGSLSINPKQGEPKPNDDVAAATVTSTNLTDVVTVGSMPIKVDGFPETAGFLRVGSIPLDPRVLQREKQCTFTKNQV